MNDAVDTAGLAFVGPHLALQLGIVWGETQHGRQVGAGRSSPSSHPVSGQAEFGAVRAHPAHRRLGVVDRRWVGRWRQPIVHRSDPDAVRGQRGQPRLRTVRLVAELPSAAMEVEHRGRVFNAVGQIEVQGQLDPVGVCVDDVGLDVHSAHESSCCVATFEDARQTA